MHELCYNILVGVHNGANCSTVTYLDINDIFHDGHDVITMVVLIVAHIREESLEPPTGF